MQYDSIASCYDALNCDVDYVGIANRISSIFSSYGIKKGDLVLDLCCGTGNVTLPLFSLGYDMTGVDVSDAMLNSAREKKDGDKILWLCQDMREFELYGTVKGVCSVLDSVNYLTKKEDLIKTFSLVHNYLEPDGIFVFDVNSEYKFKNVYGDNDYILESDGVFCGWRNHYNERTKNCDFYLTLFSEDEKGIKRYDEYQREHFWSDKTLKSVLETTGFEVLSIEGGYENATVTNETERLVYVARCKKG